MQCYGPVAKRLGEGPARRLACASQMKGLSLLVSSLYSFNRYGYVENGSDLSRMDKPAFATRRQSTHAVVCSISVSYYSCFYFIHTVFFSFLKITFSKLSVTFWCLDDLSFREMILERPLEPSSRPRRGISLAMPRKWWIF